MSEVFKIKCLDCGKEIEVISPATLNCQNCGGGEHEFEKEMYFECFYKHPHIGKKSNPQCEGCIVVERTMFRTFRVNKQIGSEDNKMPIEDKVEKKVITTRSGLKKRRPRKKIK